MSTALTRSDPRRLARLRANGWLPALLGVAALLAAMLTVTGMNALRAAGLNGQAPPNSGPIKKLADTTADNAVWLIITGLTPTLVFIAVLLIFGSKTAPDWLGKVVGAIFIVLVVIPVIVA